MKNYIKIVFVAVFAAIAEYGVYTSQKVETMSDLTLANIEAFAAQGEYDTPYYVAPCPHGPGSECRSAKYDDGNRCGTLSYC